MKTSSNTTGVQVPTEIVTQLGSSKRPAVSVTIKHHTYRSTVAMMGGVFMLPISAENRTLANVNASDEIEVKLELDTQPRELSIPLDLQEALDRNSKAKQFFESQSYSNRRRIVLSIEGAKTAETRLRRITKTVENLHAGNV